MRLMGASEQHIHAHTAHLVPDDDFYIVEKGWPVLEWFLDVSDLIASNGFSYRGFVPTEIEAEARLSGRKTQPEQFQQLRIMGREAAIALNERHKKA
ncbi:MAG: hypothetical protein Alis3KO_01020 [Aliiglaciecola sp.]